MFRLFHIFWKLMEQEIHFMEHVSVKCCYVLYTVSDVFDVQFQWPWTRTLQGHPRSNVVVPINSSLVVSYLISIVSNIVPLTVFEIFDAKILWLRSRTVQGHSISKVVVPIESPLVVFYLTSFESNIVYLAIVEIFNIKVIFPWAMVRINSTSVLADKNI